MRISAPFLRLASILLTASLFAGCGGGSDDGPISPTQPSAIGGTLDSLAPGETAVAPKSALIGPGETAGTEAGTSTADATPPPTLFHGLPTSAVPGAFPGATCAAADAIAIEIEADCSRITGWRLGMQRIHVAHPDGTVGEATVRVIPQRHWASFAGEAGYKGALTLVTTPDGRALAWGSNWAGLLGRNEADFHKVQPLPKPVLRRAGPQALGQVVQTSASANSAMALTEDGRAWIWGDAYYAADSGKVVAGAIPMVGSSHGDVVERVVGVATANRSYALVLDDGSVLGWGAYGSTAVDGPTRYPGPVLTEAGQPLTGVRTVVSGWVSMLALDSAGRVWAWGASMSPTNGEQTRARTLKQANGSELTDIVSLVAGGSFVLALAADGQVYGAGDNRSAQLGQGHADEIPGWTAVPIRDPSGSGPLSNIAMLAAGTHVALALDHDGRVWSWGSAVGPIIGCGQASCSVDSPLRPYPRPVISEEGDGPLGEVVAIKANYTHALALKRDGTVLTWGHAGPGLGQGAIDPARTSRPVAVKDETGHESLRLDPAAYPNLVERFR